MKILEQFLHPDIERYAEEYTSAEDDTLKAINRKTHLQMLRPRMLSGAYQGRLLQMFSAMLKPCNILEIGTYVGYSAICLAKGLPPEGHIDTIEVDEELEDIILENISQANLSNKISLHIGKALDIIPPLNKTYDLVFIDADKANYLAYYELALEKVQSGSFILADNILWSGKVLYEQALCDKETAALKTFNSFVHTDNRVENILLPIRDGLMLIRKK